MNTDHQHITLIGIGNQPKPMFYAKIQAVINSHAVFSGGKRHYDLVKPFLPSHHQWIYIKGGMEALMNTYVEIGQPIVVFASGDPLFYGFGNTLQRLLPKVKLSVYPYFNSIQRLCHKTQTNYNELQTVSVHGRDWSALDQALINRQSLIGVLTDGVKNPSVIAKRMLQYQFDNYQIIIGEELDGTQEKISTLTLSETIDKNFASLNCVLLKQTSSDSKPLGIADNQFHHLPNRANMITKMPVRLTTIHALNLKQHEVFWDIGACTGAVAIEAKQHQPTLKVVAFEKRTICKEIIQINKEQFSTPGIEVIIDDFFELNLTDYPCPDVVFIGGHGGRLEEMILKVTQLNPNVRMVTNAVQQSTTTTFVATLTKLGYSINTVALQVNEHNKIQIHTAVKSK